MLKLKLVCKNATGKKMSFVKGKPFNYKIVLKCIVKDKYSGYNNIET